MKFFIKLNNLTLKLVCRIHKLMFVSKRRDLGLADISKTFTGKGTGKLIGIEERNQKQV